VLAVRSLLVCVVAALLIAPTVASAAPPPVVSPGVYLSDLTAGSAALQRFGKVLVHNKGVDALLKKQTALRRSLTTFDRHLYVMSRYRLADPKLNGQRARLARAAPPVTETLFDFFDAILTKDVKKVDRLAPIVEARLNAFAAAAN
jgi:hypothetical protein